MAIALVLATTSGCDRRPRHAALRRCDPTADALDVSVELAPRSIPEVRIEGEWFGTWHDELRVPADEAFVVHFLSRGTSSRVRIPALGWAADVPRDGTVKIGLCAGSVTPSRDLAIVIGDERRRLPLEVVTRESFESWRVADDGSCHITSNRRPEESIEVWRGRIFFEAQGCGGCHGEDDDDSPSLRAMSERVRVLEDGTTRIADDAYFDDSIRTPEKDVVAGYTSVRMAPAHDAPPNVGRYVRAYVESQNASPP